MSAEGWSSEKDDAYTDGSLATAAGAYIVAANASPAERAVADQFGNDGLTFKMKSAWPPAWGMCWFKPKSRRRDLVRAAALLAAEIERLDRAAIAAAPSVEGNSQQAKPSLQGQPTKEG
jgi:hypothetical protein